MKKVREEETFYYTKDLDTGRISKRMIPCIGVVVLENVILQIETNVFKNSDAIRVDGVGKHDPGGRSDVYDDNRQSDDDADDEVLSTCSDTYIEWSNECPNRMLDDQIQCEKSKDSRDGMCDDNEREKNMEKTNFRCVKKKMRRKVDTEIDDHTKADIFTNELKKYMKVMNELKEHNFGSLLKRVISKCDLNAFLFEENTEIVSDGKLEENQSIPRIHAVKHKSNA